MLLLLVGVAVCVLTLSQLGRTPPPWWDEGWSMLVARHLVQDGIYGTVSADGPKSSGMAASIVTTLPIALSFRLLGVDVWQARLPASIFTLIALAVVFVLTRALYGSKVAWWSIPVLLLTATHLSTNPLYAGRQVLGEPLQIAALLGGYAVMLTSKQHPLRAWSFAIILWGLAILAKGQTLPFWAASLVVSALVALLQRRWRMALTLGGALAGGRAAAWGLSWLIEISLGARIPASEFIPDVAAIVGFAPVAAERINALLIIVIAGLPTCAGICWAGWKLLRHPRQIDLDQPAELVRMMLLVCSSAWLAWFLLLAVGWARYLFPVLVLAAPFSAALLYQVTSGFNVQIWLQSIIANIKQRRFGASLAGLLAAVLLALAVPTTVMQLYGSYQGDQVAPLHELTTFLNTQTPPDALIETYESEILFLLHRPYHYPPDALNVTLLQRGVSGSYIPLHYDPLAANPDYLVTSYYVANIDLYEPVITAGHFRLIKRFGWYEVYERVR